MMTFIQHFIDMYAPVRVRDRRKQERRKTIELTMDTGRICPICDITRTWSDYCLCCTLIIRDMYVTGHDHDIDIV